MWVARVKPSTSYLVCASQRGGTTLLCRALADIGVAGRPDEYFLAVDERGCGWRGWEHGPFGRARQARDREHYLDIVSEFGSTPNGVFGAKLMWNNVPWATAKIQEMPRFSGLDRAAVLHAAFPNLHVVHMTRRDRVRQAVSWARMAQDGVWVVSDDEPARPSATPRYDFDLISDLEALIVEGELGWRDLFDELGLVPYEVVYEDVVADAHNENVTSTAHRAHPRPLRSPTPDAAPQSPTAAKTSPGTAAEARLEQGPGWSMLSQYPLFRSAVTINGNRAAIMRPKSITTEDHTTASPPASLADHSCGGPAAAPVPGTDPTLIGRTICVVRVRVGSAQAVVLL
jgi:trehalose 2-sulfotransferase